jgi:hypothetical protein
VVDDVAPAIGRTGVKEETLAGRFEPVDRLFDAEGRRRKRGQHHAGVGRPEIYIGGTEQGQAVTATVTFGWRRRSPHSDPAVCSRSCGLTFHRPWES